MTWISGRPPTKIELSNPSAGGDGAIVDGVNSAIKATVTDLASSNPLSVAIVDGSGAQITSFGGGTQYTEGDTDATITGTAMMMEGAGNTLLPVQGTTADGILVNLGANNDVVVSATNLDVRDLTATDVVTVTGGAGQTADVKITLDGESVPVTGTFWQATQPVSGTVTATAQPGVDIGDVTINNPSIAVTQSGTWDEVGINDSGNSITVDAPVGTPVFVRLSDGASAIATLPVSLASVPSHDVTNAGIFAVQSTNQANSGVDIGDVTINNASGASAVNIQDGGNSITVDGAVTISGTVAVTQSGVWDEVGINDSGNSITVDDGGSSLTVDGTGTFTTKELRASTGTNTSVADSATSVTILASNANRLGASVTNDSSAVLYLLLGATTASTTNYTVRIAQYGYYEVPFSYTGQLTGIWATDPGDGAARVTELT
jgi:hypothetical protein